VWKSLCPCVLLRRRAWLLSLSKGTRTHYLSLTVPRITGWSPWCGKPHWSMMVWARSLVGLCSQCREAQREIVYVGGIRPRYGHRLGGSRVVYEIGEWVPPLICNGAFAKRFIRPCMKPPLPNRCTGICYRNLSVALGNPGISYHFAQLPLGATKQKGIFFLPENCELRYLKGVSDS